MRRLESATAWAILVTALSLLLVSCRSQAANQGQSAEQNQAADQSQTNQNEASDQGQTAQNQTADRASAAKRNQSAPAGSPGGTVDCDAVVRALRSGKRGDQVATSMNIPTSSVFRCLRQANKMEMEQEVRQHAAEKSVPPADASQFEHTP